MSLSKINPQMMAPAQPQEKNPQVEQAAKLYENQFLRQMVKAMRQTVPENEVVPVSQGEKIFREQLDSEYVDQWTERGGIGLADQLYGQIMDKFFPGPMPLPPQGPVPLNETKATTPLVVRPQDVTYKVQPRPQQFNVLAPWDGKVLGSQSLGQGLTSLLIEHNNNESGTLQSTLLFKGSLLVPEGKEITAGQRVGLLSPDNDGLLWRVQR